MVASRYISFSFNTKCCKRRSKLQLILTLPVPRQRLGYFRQCRMFTGVSGERAEMRVMREGRTIDRAVWLAKRGGACKELDPGTLVGAAAGSTMRESHFCEMRWYSEISTAAFCDSLDLRRILLQKRQSFGRGKWRPPLLEPSSAEFISALAAGINSRHTLQIGCGLSTLALAAAARATDSCLWSVHYEKEKQGVVQYFLKDMGLIDYVEFITEDPSTFIPQREGLEFVLLSGLPERYIELFDLLKLKKGAIVVADNALDDTTNAYIRHVRRQPGVDSSTLPLSRGIEVTKIVTWEEFKAGRKKYGGIEDPINDKAYMARRPGLQGAAASNQPLSCSSLLISASSDDVSSHNSGSRPNIVVVQAKEKNLETSHRCRENPGNPFGCDESEPIIHTALKPSSHNSGFRANIVVVKAKEKNPEMSDSNRESTVNPFGLDESEHVTHITLESDKLESPHHDVLEEQFKSIQSLAEQWRLQLAAKDESSGASAASAENTGVVLPDQMGDEPVSFSTRSEPSVGLPLDRASEDVLHASLPKMESDDNETSLPSSDASIAEKVSPEPLESEEAMPSIEATTSGNDAPLFQVYFYNKNGQTEVTVKGVDQEMLLFDLTLAFNETGVSVKRAKISTQDISVVDVFYVVDGGTKGPLLEPRWEVVRKRILDRLAERRLLLQNQ